MSRYTREQYEAMARAGRYHIYTVEDDAFIWKRGDGSRPWNPDTDPADNYRLAIDAGMEVGTCGDYAFARFFTENELPIFWYAPINGEKLEATMTAVCNCAIKIGEGMK